jgi:hypothetical protein
MIELSTTGPNLTHRALVLAAKETTANRIGDSLLATPIDQMGSFVENNQVRLDC